jgi:hypothetical protein
MPAPYCPVTPEARAWLDYRWAWLRREFGLKRLREHPLILPNDTFFPDPYRGTPEDVEKLLARVAGFMGVDVHSLELHYYEEQEDQQTTAGYYRENDAGKFEVWLEVAQLRDLESMIATMAHELGHVLLLGHKRITSDDQDHEPLTDLITVYMGMGVFVANSVLQESSWDKNYRGTWGWQLGKQGYLPMHEFGYGFALYAVDREETSPSWLKALRLDVRTACKQSIKVLTTDSYYSTSLEAVPYPFMRREGVVEDEEEEETEPNEEKQLRCRYCRCVMSSSLRKNLINGLHHRSAGIVRSPWKKRIAKFLHPKNLHGSESGISSSSIAFWDCSLWRPLGTSLPTSCSQFPNLTEPSHLIFISAATPYITYLL